MLLHAPMVLCPKRMVDVQCPIGVGIHEGYVRNTTPGTGNMTVTIFTKNAPLCVNLEMEIVRNFGSVRTEDTPALIVVWQFPNEQGETFYFIASVITLFNYSDDETEATINKEDM